VNSMRGCPNNRKQAAFVACGKISMAVVEAIMDQRLLSFGFRLEMLSHVSVIQTVSSGPREERSSESPNLSFAPVTKLVCPQ